VDPVPGIQTPVQDVRDRLGIGLSLVVAAAGWALALSVLVRGGDYRFVAIDLVPALPVAVIGTVTALAAWRRSVNVAVWLGVIVAFGICVNVLVFLVLYRSGTWGLLSSPGVWGADFRDGVYDPAKAFSVARSGWPPISVIVGWPFTLMEWSSAYALEVVLIAAAAVGSAILSAVLAVRAAGPGSARATTGGRDLVDAQSLAIALGVWVITSYGFMYELQRGNLNMFTLFFSLLAVWLTLRLPRSPWWPAAVLAVAISLKLYPAILLALLFWRYRMRAVVPVVVTNAVLLLVAGPANTWRFLAWLTKTAPGPRIATFGEMGASGTAAIQRSTTSWAPSWIAAPLFAVPVALWLATAIIVMRRGWSPRRAVVLAAASVPPMAVLPTLSNDYKLVLFVFPLAVLVVALARPGAERGRLWWCLGFGVLLWLFVFMSRSSVFHPWALLGSKYSLAVLVQIMLVVVAWRWDGPLTEEPKATREGAVGQIDEGTT
jgi:hypothetical protein